MVSNLPGKGLDKLYITMNVEDFGLIFCHWNNNCNNNCKENTVAYVPVKMMSSHMAYWEPTF